MPIAVYVSNADSGDIWVLHLDVATGALSPVQRVMVGGQVMPMALSPDRRFLYAARRSDPLEVLSFAIDARSGELNGLGEAPLPHSMAFIATDRRGRFLFSASYGGDLIAVSRIGADGIVQPAQQVLPTEPRAHAIQADPSNRFVLATSLGGGIVLQQRFNEISGRLAPNEPASFSPHDRASPRHFVFSPDARFVYLLNELDATIDVLAFDAGSGTLRTTQTTATLPPGFGGEPWAADIRLTPDGRFLYSSERRSSTLAAFSVDAGSGALSLVGHTLAPTQPRGFNITADGGFLIVAGQLSHRLGVFAIEPHTGALLPRSECTVGQGPNWVESLALTV